MKILIFLFCLTIIASGPLVATELGVPLPPKKEGKIVLKDGRIASPVNERLFIEDNGKLIHAPPGSYTAANGTIWTVDPGGQTHSAPLKPSPNPAPAQAAQPKQSAPQDAPSLTPQLNADGLKNIPAALKGLKIFMPGNALGLKFQKISPLQSQRRAHADTEAQPGGSSNKVVLSPNHPMADVNNYLGFSGANGGPILNQYPYPFGLSFMNSPNSYFTLNFSCPTGGFLRIDLSLDFDHAPPGSWQINVAGPDGSVETFPNPPPDDPTILHSPTHISFGYSTQGGHDLGNATVELPVIQVYATTVQGSPTSGGGYEFNSATATVETQ